MQNASSEPSEIALMDFAKTIAGMNRFITGLAMIPPFVNTDIGLSEWVVLMELKHDDGLSNSQLAKRLGVSGQRINQIIGDLSECGLIIISASLKDSRRNEIRMSSSGRAELDALNQRLGPLIADAFNRREHLLTRLPKQVGHLAKFVAAVRLANANPTSK